MPPAVARLNSDGGSASGSSASPARAVAASARLRLSTSSSSTICRGASPSSRSWTVTPQVEWIGRQVPVGSTSGGRPRPGRHEHGVGADRRPVAEDHAGDAAAALQSAAPASRPRQHRAPLLGQRGPGGGGGLGRHREAGGDSRTAAGPGASDGSSRWSASGSISSGSSSGKARSMRSAWAAAASGSRLRSSRPAGSSPIEKP